MTFDYTKYTVDVQTQIAKYGGTVYLHNTVDCGVNSPTGLSTCNNIVIPTKGVLKSFNDVLVDGTQVLESDKELLIGVDLGRPIVGNSVTAGDILYRIISVKAVNPDVAQPIAYKLHLRNFTLAEDLTEFVTTLKSLAIGSIVTDPKSVRDYPKWFVLAHGHHASNITTLMEYRPHYTYRYDDAAPAFNRWGDSDMYEYLTTTYLSTLSIELNAVLQAVPIETGGFTPLDDDKISLLSLEELTGIEGALGSSGSYISYFDSDIKRVALDETSLENVKYWTRDIDSSSYAWVITQTGGREKQALANIYNVRPIIFLQGANNVVLTSPGEYEFQF